MWIRKRCIDVEKKHANKLMIFIISDWRDGWGGLGKRKIVSSVLFGVWDIIIIINLDHWRAYIFHKCLQIPRGLKHPIYLPGQVSLVVIPPVRRLRYDDVGTRHPLSVASASTHWRHTRRPPLALGQSPVKFSHYAFYEDHSCSKNSRPIHCVMNAKSTRYIPAWQRRWHIASMKPQVGSAGSVISILRVNASSY